MRINDVNIFKGKIKSIIQSWINDKVDKIIPNMASTRTFVKNGVNNMMTRWDDALNKKIDWLFLFAADSNGTVDSETMIDIFADMFEELPNAEFEMAGFKLTTGNKMAMLKLPQNMFIDMLVGHSGAIKFTKEDIIELKNYLN